MIPNTFHKTTSQALILYSFFANHLFENMDSAS